MPEPGSRRFTVAQEAVSRASGSGQRSRPKLTGEQAPERKAPISSRDEPERATLGCPCLPPLSRTGRKSNAPSRPYQAAMV